jgi:hypothetical protein
VIVLGIARIGLPADGMDDIFFITYAVALLAYPPVALQHFTAGAGWIKSDAVELAFLSE